MQYSNQQPAPPAPQNWFHKLLSQFRNNWSDARDWFWDTIIVQKKEAVKDIFMHLRWHLKELLLCFLLLFLFASLDKVQHFFTAFATDLRVGSFKFSVVLFGLTVHGLAVLWLSYVFWHKPKNLKVRWANIVFGDRRDRSYETYYARPEGRWWVAVVSSLPVLLLNFALCVSLLQDNTLGIDKIHETQPAKWIVENRLAAFLAAVVVYVFLSTLFRPRLRSNVSIGRLSRMFAQRVLLLLLVIVALIVSFTWYSDFGKYAVPRVAFLLTFVMVPPIVLGHVWYAASNCLIEEKDQIGKAKRRFDDIFDMVRYASYGISIVIFALVNQSPVTASKTFSLLMPPVPMLLFIFIFYYQVWDFILHNVTRMRRNLALIIVILAGLFVSQNEHLLLKFKAKTPAQSLKRANLDEYFLTWAKDRFEGPQRDSVVYLVTAEGGGSRSGAWTAAVLTQLDSATHGGFRRQCFAISTVSGGSIGTAATLSLWDHANLFQVPADSLYRNIKASKLRDGRNDSKYIETVFRRNYISNALAGIFFYDAWQKMPIVSSLYPADKSRTDRQLDAENEAICEGLRSAFKSSEVNPKYFLETTFLRLYYDQNEREATPRPRTALPLFFPNTTRVEDGRRGVSSPVEMGGGASSRNPRNPFVAAVDVVGMAAQRNPNQAPSLAEATALSQLFPYVNSTVQVDTLTGTFMDGGAYENMGITTIQEIREGLEQVLLAPDGALIAKLFQQDTAKRAAFMKYLSSLRFRFVLIYNVDNQKTEGQCLQLKSIRMLDPLTTVMQTPFGGHTDHAYHRLKRKYGVSVRDKIIEFPLIVQETCKKRDVDIVMSRWLSKHDLKEIFVRSQNLVRARWK